MARSSSTDYFSNYRFLVALTDSKDPTNVRIQGGFSTVTMPELTLEMMMYKEGQMEYVRKFPGNPSFNDVTLTRGVTKSNTDFEKWVRAGASGQEYRGDMIIYLVHRDQFVASDNSDTNNSADASGYKKLAGYNAGLRISMKNAFATRVKFGSDMDAQGNEVSMEEIDVAYEYATIEKGSFSIAQ